MARTTLIELKHGESKFNIFDVSESRANCEREYVNDG